MKLLKYITGFMTLLWVTALHSGCEKGPNFKEYTYPAPVVEDFSPKTGYSGEDITITGSDFGANVKAVKVFFGGVQADTIRSCVNDQIVVQAPPKGISGAIVVQVYKNNDSTGTPFTFLPSARIISVSVERAKAGDEVTITGENFGTDASLIKIFIGSVEAEIISVSNTEIKFRVPDASSGNIIVKVDRQTLTGPFFLVGDDKITGTLIGHSGSWGNNPATFIAAAVDSNMSTFVDGPTKTGYVGYDVGKGKAAKLTSVRYVPRTSHPQRMTGGEIRAANDPTLYDYVTLHTISQQPPTGVYTDVAISTTEAYRYIYYYSADGYCNISEIEFYGNVIDQALPSGKFIFEFGTDGDNEGWKPQQGGTWTVSNGALNVSFTQTIGKKRSDLALLIGGNGDPVTIHTGNYPIMAIKFNKPSTCNITFDTNMGSFGNGSNKYATDLTGQDVYYWDMSTLTLGGTGAHPNEEITFGSTFQLKIADVPEAAPETGYSVQWIRTFESKQALLDFLN